MSFDLFGGERALLMDVQRLGPQRAVPPLAGGRPCGLAAAFEGHPWGLVVTA